MNKIYNTLALVAIILISVSCKRDIMDDIDDGSWNNERGIINIVFEGQAGKSSITRDANNNGLVSFMFNELGNDNSKIKIRSLELSAGASSDYKVGDMLNFDNEYNTALITVTSQTGKERIWKVAYRPFSDELIGKWKITTLSVYGGAWPEYGGSAAFQNMAERTWSWKGDNTGPIAEYDNTLTFTLEGIAENGDTYGTLVNDAGADGLYADFIFIDDPDGAKTPIDVNYHYRKIPTGTSKWKRNSSQGTVIFTDSEGTETTAYFVEAGTEQQDDGSSTITVAKNAFSFKLKPTYIWIDIYKDREKIVENAKKYWVQVSKVE